MYGKHSASQTGAAIDVAPFPMPTMILLAANMAVFCAADCRTMPMMVIIAATAVAFFRPYLSLSMPVTGAEMAWPM